jgi:glycosyltransferase involved in cell wall biosynthesis
MRCPRLNELPPPPNGKTGWPWTEESEQLPETMPDGRPWPRVSVVTPSYNQGRFIEETLRSVMLQGYPDLEYIVTDGGSTDDSVDTIKNYEPWLSHWVSEKDRGQSHAINKGWKMSTGKLIAYLNSDDIYYPNTIREAVLAWHENACPAVIYSDAVATNEEGRFMTLAKSYPFDLKRMREVRNPIRQPAAFLSRKEVAAIDWIDESLHFVMDYDLWYRLGRRYPLAYVQGKPWATMRQHSLAKTSACDRAIRAEFTRILTTRLVEEGYSEDSDYQRQLWRVRHFRSAINLARSGQRREAISSLLKALRIAPMFVVRQPIMTLVELSARLVVGKSWFRTRHYAMRIGFPREG